MGRLAGGAGRREGVGTGRVDGRASAWLADAVAGCRRARRPARGRHRMRRAQVNDDGAAGGRAAHRDRGGRQLDRERAARSGRYPPVAQPDGGGPPRRPVRAVRGRPQPGRRGAGRRRDEDQPGQQPLSGNQATLVRAAVRAVPHVPGDPLAPQRARGLVPAGDGHRQACAPRVRAQRTHHQAGRGELLLHPGDAHRDMAGRQAERGNQVAAVKLAGRFQPPQRKQFPVTGIEPAGRLRGLGALARQPEPHDRQLHEVGCRIGHLVAELGHGRGLPGPVVLAHLPDRDRDQPGPERCRIAQAAEAAHRAKHGLLHHVVDVGVAAQRPADDVVDQRQVAGQQAVESAGVSSLSGDHRPDAEPSAAGHVHGSSRSSRRRALHPP